MYKTFAAGLFILLNTYNMRLTQVVIDEEYPGQNKLIEEMLGKLFRTFEIGSRIKKDRLLLKPGLDTGGSVETRS